MQMAELRNVVPVNRDFERFFRPQSIAIVGASATEGAISSQPLKFLLANGYKGRVYPVNPRYDDIAGHKCYPGVEVLPEIPDLVLIVIAAKNVPAILEQCGRKGVQFVITLSSGFAETGEDGVRAQQAIVDIAGRYGITLIGPNCQGMMNIPDGIQLGFGAPFGLSYRKGNVSLVSQSGAFGNAILMLAEEGGLGFRRYVSTGNESCTTSLDLIEHLIADEGTKLIAAYVEGFKDAKKLVSVARKALAADKPLMMWKVGNSAAGAKAAMSHTANLCGAPSVYKAAFKQSGIIAVRDIDELIDCAQGLLSSARPAGTRVGIVTLSGGAGIAMADRCEEMGLSLPELDPSTIKRLKQLLPSFATTQNPLDLTAEMGANDAAFADVLRVLIEDPNIDLIGLPMAAMSGPVGTRFAKAIAAVKATTSKPIFVAWNARQSDAGDAYQCLADAGIPRYVTPARCANGMSAAALFAQAQRQSATEVATVRPFPTGDLSEFFGRGTLTEYESKKLLARFDIPITEEVLARTREEAIRAAAKLGSDVVLKIQSPVILHKSDIGGVKVGLCGEKAVAEAFDDIIEKAAAHVSDDQVDGVLVQQMVRGGVEVILGIDNTSVFGPTIMFGLGGIFAEIMQDISIRIAPVSRREAMEMIREIKGLPILNGARGRPKADIDALCDALMALSSMAVNLRSTVSEVDINPLFVLPEGQGVVVGDALICMRQDELPPVTVKHPGEEAMSVKSRVSEIKNKVPT